MKPNLVRIQPGRWDLYINGKRVYGVNAPPPSNDYDLLDVIEEFRTEKLKPD